MALSLKDAETDGLTPEAAKLTGDSLTDAVSKALAERFDAVALHCAYYDTRMPDEIIWYDGYGVPRALAVGCSTA
jgi:antitoxin VapB